MKKKTFHSFNAFKKYHFPKEYRKEMEKVAKIRLGFGKYLAGRFLAKVQAELKEESK